MMTAERKDECEPKTPASLFAINWEEYREGHKHGSKGFDESANPWLRDLYPNEHISWHRGFLAGKYKTK